MKIKKFKEIKKEAKNFSKAMTNYSELIKEEYERYY